MAFGSKMLKTCLKLDKPSNEVNIDLGASINRNVEFLGYTPDTYKPNCRFNWKSQSVNFLTLSPSIFLGICTKKIVLIMSPYFKVVKNRLVDLLCTKVEDGKNKKTRIMAVKLNNILNCGMQFGLDYILSSFIASKKLVDLCFFSLWRKIKLASLAINNWTITFLILSIVLGKAAWFFLMAKTTSVY